jgi:hypothetical protein
LASSDPGTGDCPCGNNNCLPLAAGVTDGVFPTTVEVEGVGHGMELKLLGLTALFERRPAALEACG